MSSTCTTGLELRSGYIIFRHFHSHVHLHHSKVDAKWVFYVFSDFLWVLFIWTGSRETNRWLPASLTQRPGSNPYFLIACFSNCPDWKHNDFEVILIYFASFFHFVVCTDLDRRWCGNCCCPATRWLQLCLGCVTFAYSRCAWSPSQVGCSCIESEIMVATCNLQRDRLHGCKPSGILSAVEVDGILCSSYENPEATVYIEEPCVIILLEHVEILCRVALDPRW